MEIDNQLKLDACGGPGVGGLWRIGENLMAT